MGLKEVCLHLVEFAVFTSSEKGLTFQVASTCGGRPWIFHPAPSTSQGLGLWACLISTPGL